MGGETNQKISTLVNLTALWEWWFFGQPFAEPRDWLLRILAATTALTGGARFGAIREPGLRSASFLASLIG